MFDYKIKWIIQQIGVGPAPSTVKALKQCERKVLSLG